MASWHLARDDKKLIIRQNSSFRLSPDLYLNQQASYCTDNGEFNAQVRLAQGKNCLFIASSSRS